MLRCRCRASGDRAARRFVAASRLARPQRAVVPPGGSFGHAAHPGERQTGGTLPRAGRAAVCARRGVSSLPTVRASRRFGMHERPYAPVAVLIIVSVLVALGTVAASLSPAIGRDRERLADLDAMAPTVPRGPNHRPLSRVERRLGVCTRGSTAIPRESGRRRGGWARLVPSDGAGDQRRVPAECVAATDPRRQLVLMKCRRSD